MEDLGRFSVVYRRIWRDGDFRALTDPAKLLFLRLMTGPELGAIPGLLPITDSGLAKGLGWTMEAFREAFLEVSRKPMAKADWDAGLVWLPKAVRYNKPQSPNVVLGWRREWPEIPECPLKVEAYYELKAFAEGLGKAFGRAFAEGLGKAFGDPSRNQEQEQEQEQEQDRAGSAAAMPPQPPAAVDATPLPAAQSTQGSTEAAPNALGGPVVALWVLLMQHVRGVERPSVTKQDAIVAYRWSAGRPPDEIDRVLRALVADDDAFVSANGWRLGLLPQRANAYLAKPKSSTPIADAFAGKTSGWVEMNK